MEKALEDGLGEITFEIEEGLYQNVQIICNDWSVDDDSNTNTYNETIENVSVSTSAAKIYWANKPLRYGTIAGSTGVVGATAAIFKFRRRRRLKIKTK